MDAEPTVFQRGLKTLRIAGWPLAALVVLAALLRFYPDSPTTLDGELSRAAAYGLRIALWLTAALVLNRLLRQVLLDSAARRAFGRPFPSLIHDVSTALVLLLTVSGIVGGVFGRPISGLWATSGVVGIVLGLALQSIILDVFTGLATHLDRTFSVDDWIELHQLDITGRVSEVNWRTTRIVNTEGLTYVVPNSILGQQILANYSARPATCFEARVWLDFEVPVERARRLLLTGVMATGEPVLDDPPPEVLVEELDERGVRYCVEYWFAPWRSVPVDRARDRVLSSILTHLERAGVRIAYPKRGLYREGPRPAIADPRQTAERSDFLRRCELFADLADEEATPFALGLEIRRFDAGAEVLTRGRSGDALLVCYEGLLGAYARPRTAGNVTAGELEVERIVPGEICGELAVLTGDPEPLRVVALTDAVVFRAPRDRVLELFARRPELMDRLASVTAVRRTALTQALRDARADAEADDDAAGDGVGEQLKLRMRSMMHRLGSMRRASNRLLIVDDAAILRRMVREIAEEAGWQVVGEAGDGEEAVTRYHELWPDLVTMDLVMPRQDGLAALEAIRRLNGKARVMMLSAVDQRDKLKAAIALGAVDFVVKPFDRDQLRETLVRLREEEKT